MRFLLTNGLDVGFDRFSVHTWPVAAIVLIVLLVILGRRKRNPAYLFCCAVFGLYILVAVDRTFFPLHISGAYADDMRGVPFMSGVNLIPFHFGRFGSLESALLGLLLNVLLTVPFGFGVSFLTSVRARRILWLAPAVGLGIETAQLVISLLLGYPYRVIDINDAGMNMLGVWIGYGMFSVFAWLYVWVSDHIAVRQRGLAAYVYELANRA